METGSRLKKKSVLQKISAFAMSRDLTAFIIPGVDIARANNLDIEASGLQIVASPRHASVLVIIGSLSAKLADSAAIIYAQMVRPRAILSLGEAQLPAFLSANVTAEISQDGLVSAVQDLRQWFSNNAFSEEVTDFEAGVLSTRIEYVCPMHPEVVQDEPGSCPKCGMFLVKREVQANSNAVNSAAQHDSHAPMAATAHSHKAHQSVDIASGKYTCPMHPEVVQDEPGSCPKCGMHLVPMDEAANAEATHDCCKSEDEASAEKHEHKHSGHDHKSHDHKSHEHHHESTEASGKYTCPMHPEIAQDGPGSCPKCGMHLVPMDEAANAEATHDCCKSEDEDPTEKHEHKHAGHDHKSHDHAKMNHGDMDHSKMDHGDDDFMSMVDVTKDLPRGDDDLPMEWIDAPFGPFFPGLPSGLVLALTLAGDAVVKTEINTITSDIILLEQPTTDFEGFVDNLARLNPLAPVSYRLLACLALENAADADVSKQVMKARIGALERERIASHLNWLAEFGQQTGFGWLQNHAANLQLKIQQADFAGILLLASEVTKLVNRVQKTPLLKARTKNIGPTPKDVPTTGPVARANGSNHDARNFDPAWLELGFSPISSTGNDAFSRLNLRLDEILQSMELIKMAEAIAMPELVKLPKPAAVELIGQSSVETARGMARLHVTLQNSSITKASLQTPSKLHEPLIAPMIDKLELGDALTTVQSLDISPWEMRF